MKGTLNANESTVNDSDNDDSLIKLPVDDRKKIFSFLSTHTHEHCPVQSTTRCVKNCLFTKFVKCLITHNALHNHHKQWHCFAQDRPTATDSGVSFICATQRKEKYMYTSSINIYYAY